VRNEAEKVGIPVINTSGAAPTLHRERSPQWMFGVGSSAAAYFAPVVDKVIRRRTAGEQVSVGVAYQNDLFGRSIRASMEETLAQADINLAFARTLGSLADLRGLFDDIRQHKPSLLVMSANDVRFSQELVSGLALQRLDVGMLALSNCRSAGLDSYGPAAEYTLCPVQWDGLADFADPYWDNPALFFSSFEVAYGSEPPHHAAQAASALIILADALERAGSVSRKPLRAALEQTNMSTLFGPIRFGTDGRNKAISPLLEQVRGGRYVMVLPANRAWVPLVAPMPAWKDRLP
jgi:branched-chain amino acid transport system substrate-binding protein